MFDEFLETGQDCAKLDEYFISFHLIAKNFLTVHGILAEESGVKFFNERPDLPLLKPNTIKMTKLLFEDLTIFF